MRRSQLISSIRLGYRSFRLLLIARVKGNTGLAGIRWRQVKVCVRVFRKAIFPFPSDNG